MSVYEGIKIGKLELLHAVFGKVSVPREVFGEVTGKGPARSGVKTIKDADWIKVTEIKDRSRLSFLLGTLDRGEAEVLTLAEESGADLVLLDEEKARKLAVIAGFDIMGLLGLFLLAKNMGLVDRIRPIIDELRRKKFRISERIVSATLERAGE